MLPVYGCDAVGENVTVTACDPFAGTVPLVKLPLNPAGYVTLVMVSSPVPVLPIVSVAVAAVPTVMLPKAMLPLNAMVDVGVGAVGVSLLQPDRRRSAAKPAEQNSDRMRDRVQGRYQSAHRQNPRTFPLELARLSRSNARSKNAE